MPKPPSRRSSSGEIEQFLQKSKAITQVVERQPRLIFAIDATASRQPTWDTACQLQGEMFRASASVDSLAVQLCYYRGLSDFYASRWLSDSARLGQLMGGVFCEGGHTQIARLLRHALKEQRESRARALVFIGDALEENPDTVCDLAGQCGMLQLPLFLFQEGVNSQVERTFRNMARVSGGAYARFDAHSAHTLAALLGAVANFAAGGRAALESTPGDSAKLLLKQLKP